MSYTNEQVNMDINDKDEKQSLNIDNHEGDSYKLKDEPHIETISKFGDGIPKAPSRDIPPFVDADLDTSSLVKFAKGHVVNVMKIETNQIITGKIIEIKGDDLFKIDFGNGNLEDDVHLSRIKEQIGSVNQWTQDKDKSLKIMLAKLKFNREITRFYFYKICKEEGYWSWMIIILATFTSTITLGNNITNEPFPYYFTIIKILLTVVAASTTLVAAWIKKQSYIERINNCDRYLQKVAHLIESFDVILIHNPSDRMTYTEFSDKILPSYKNLSITPPMSPNEQKHCEFLITVNYPEIISRDNDNENKLWPWFDIPMGYDADDCDVGDDIFVDDNNINDIPLTGFGESVIRSYITEKKTKERFSLFKCFGCLNQNENDLVTRYYEYFGYDYDIDTKRAIIPFKDSRFVRKMDDYVRLVNSFNRNPIKTYNMDDILCLNDEFRKYLNGIVPKFKLENAVNGFLYGKVDYIKIFDNSLAYLCNITSDDINIRQKIIENRIGSRVIKAEHIDSSNTNLITEDKKNEIIKNLSESLV